MPSNVAADASPAASLECFAMKFHECIRLGAIWYESAPFNGGDRWLDDV